MKVALIFSGYNQRAVIALCRYFKSIEYPFTIVACGPKDLIYKTKYADSVLLERKDRLLTTELFLEISKYNRTGFIYLPTSEFLNSFVLKNTEFLKSIGIEPGMPAKDIYYRITNKWSSQELLKNQSNILIPEIYVYGDEKIPCVLRPFRNINNGKVLYPLICKTSNELNKNKISINCNDYFIQKYIVGQSYYFCSFLTSGGCFEGYWQENLLQQPGGKSMVFARVCENPGIKVDGLMKIINKSGYFGPLMVEFILYKNEFYFIEINPRFWGPLQLCLEQCPQILDAYVSEWFGIEYFSDRKESDGFYSWYYGAKNCKSELKAYPRLEQINNVEEKLFSSDVYSRLDTLALSRKY